MGNRETIKYFNQSELKNFFKELEKTRRRSETDFQEKCAARNEALFAIMYYCALRVSETLNLEIDDYNSIRKEIYCRRIKGGNNNTLRIIDDWVLKIFERHLRLNKPTTYLFTPINSNNKPLSRKTCDKIMKKTCKNICIPKNKRHCHVMRHTKAISLAESGLDIREIQYWLGHSNVANTEIYLKFTTAQYETMYKKLQKRKKEDTIIE